MKTTLSTLSALLLSALFCASALAATPQPTPSTDTTPSTGFAQDTKKAEKKDEKKAEKKDEKKKEGEAELSDEDRARLEAIGYVE